MTKSVVAAAFFMCAVAGAWAQTPVKPVKIGVLEDMSSFYSDITGRGSVIAAQMAIEDFGKTVLGRPIQLVHADHHAKPDVGSTTARQWYDEGVGLITGLGNSAVALAVRSVASERGSIDIVASAGVSDLTGKNCSPTGFHWGFDSYSLSKPSSEKITKDGGKKWFYMTADYAWGHNVQAQSTRVVNEAGGTVVGFVKIPTQPGDFSSFLVKAQNSKADVIALASAGGDTTLAIKQAAEFGIQKNQTLVAMAIFISDIHSLGLQVAKDLYLSESFYWDLNDQTREWSTRFYDRMKRMPTTAQASVYGATLHYLKAVREAGTDDPKKVAEQMRKMPVNDFWSNNVMLRADGRAVRPTHLFRVKTPAQSKKPWDYYTYISTVPAEAAVRPLSESECPLVK